jgi:hypothetical protein
MAPHPLTPPSDQRFAFGLTPTDVEEFRAILESECDEKLSIEEAWSRAIQILALYRMLLGPIPEDPQAAEFEHRSS